MKITGLGSIDDYPRPRRCRRAVLRLRSVFLSQKNTEQFCHESERRSLNYNVQIGSFSELKFWLIWCRNIKPVHLTFNSLYYRPEQYEEITQIIQQCRSIGFDSYILADPALRGHLRKEKIDCKGASERGFGNGEFCHDRGFAKEYPKGIIFSAKIRSRKCVQ